MPKEIYPNEKRIAISPEATAKLVKQGFNVTVEAGAGAAANFSDSDFEKAGATMVDAREALGSDIVLKVRAPQESEVLG